MYLSIWLLRNRAEQIINCEFKKGFTIVSVSIIYLFSLGMTANEAGSYALASANASVTALSYFSIKAECILHNRALVGSGSRGGG